MAPKVLKRPAATAGPAPKRGRAASAEKAKCDIVSMAVMSHKGLPESTLKMLCGGIPSVLTVMKEERHYIQTAFVEMIAKVMAGVEAQYTKEIESYQEKVDGADGSKATLEQEQNEAGKELERLKAATVAAEEAASADTKLAKEAEVALLESQVMQKTGDAHITEVEVGKAKVDSIVSSLLVPGKEAAITGREGKQLIKALHSLGKELKIDASMLETAESVFHKDPASRGTFDKLMEKQLEDCLAAKSIELAAEQEKLMPGKLERQWLVEEKKAEKDAATEKAIASKATLQAAKAAEDEGAKILADRTNKVKNFIPELKKISDDLDTAKAALESFKAGALQTFTDLKELAPPPSEPEPAAEEPVAEELAAKEPAVEETATTPAAAEEATSMETEAAPAAA